MIKKIILRFILAVAIALILISGYYFVFDAHGTADQSNFDMIALASLVLGLVIARLTVYKIEGPEK